jgi:hypothetical protein
MKGSGQGGVGEGGRERKVFTNTHEDRSTALGIFRGGGLGWVRLGDDAEVKR